MPLRWKTCLVALLALPLAGCLGPREGFMEGFMDDFSVGFEVELGSVEMRSVRVSESRDLLGAEVRVRVDASLAAHGAGNVTLVALLDDAPCSPYGPPSAPETPVDRATLRRPLEGEETWTLHLEARMLPGTPASVYVEAQGEEGFSPIFGQCRDVRA